MTISDYFSNTSGHGVLATADNKGKVNAAVYAKPYFTDEKTAVFIMAERLSYDNLKSNPNAVYLFIESTSEWTGKRLYLKKVKEEKDLELLTRICQVCDYSHYDAGERHLTYFEVQEVLPLIGGY
jgi:putative heme iron utilization protein